jgi:phosphotransferase system HPr (HPr) family protein
VAERRLQVTGRLGLHARAAANLVRVASQFQKQSHLQRLDGNAEADAKSILSILTLAASRGTDLQIVAHGDDEQEALDAVVGLFSRDFDETRRTIATISRAIKSCVAKGSAFRMAS